MSKAGRAILTESNKNLKPWREKVAAAAAGGSYIERPHPVALALVFIMPRPASTPRTKTPPATKRPDLDKLLRACCDSLTGVLYEDDSQVVSVSMAKRLAQIDEQPGVHITLSSTII